MRDRGCVVAQGEVARRSVWSKALPRGNPEEIRKLVAQQPNHLENPRRVLNCFSQSSKGQGANGFPNLAYGILGQRLWVLPLGGGNSSPLWERGRYEDDVQPLLIKKQTKPPQSNPYAENGLYCGVGGFGVWFLFWLLQLGFFPWDIGLLCLLAFAACLLGGKGLNYVNNHPGAPGRWLAITAFLMGVLEFMGAFFLLFFGRMGH